MIPKLTLAPPTPERLQLGAISASLLGGASALAWLLSTRFSWVDILRIGLLVLVAAVSLVACLAIGGRRTLLQLAVTLIIITVTFHTQRFGVPFKPDGVAVAILVGILLFAAPGSLLSFWRFPLVIPIIGYLLSNLTASLLYSPIPDISLTQTAILAGRAMTFFGVVIAVQLVPELRRRWTKWLLWLVIVHTFVGLVGMVVYRFQRTPFVVFGQNGGSSISINGFFLEPNLYAAFVLSVLSLFMPILLYSGEKAGPLAYSGFAIGLIGLVLSYTRSSWLGLILVAGCLSLCIMTGSGTGARRRFVVLFFAFSLTASVLVFAFLSLALIGVESPLMQRFQAIVDRNSVSSAVRISVWKLGIEHWHRHEWIGNGPLSLSGIVGGDGWVFSSVLQALADSGIIGAFFMLWLILGCAAYTWRAFRLATNDWDRGAALGYFLAQIGLFFTSQFSSFFWGGFTWALFGLAVGHSMIVVRESRALARSRQHELLPSYRTS